MKMLAKSLIPSVSMISLGTPRLADKVSESRPSAVSLNSSRAATEMKKERLEQQTKLEPRVA